MYKQFIFETYEFDKASGSLKLHYSIDDALHFTEEFVFHAGEFAYNQESLDTALWTLFIMAGISYYKTYLPGEIIINNNRLNREDAEFFATTWQEGLGEFFYVNQLDPHTRITFPYAEASAGQATNTHDNGLLVGLGGGKDSLVTIEALRQHRPITTWSLGHKTQLSPLSDVVGLRHVWVDRIWDRRLLQLNDSGAYNGHIPISAVFACAGAVLAVLTGNRDTVVSNEQSANEPTLEYQGKQINHQYSKSQQFEQQFQAYLNRHFGDSLRYYSFLRPLSELRIAEIFARHDFAKYHDVFSSCNRAFTHNSPGLFWCGECAKCAFVCMVLAPFTEEHERLALWNGKNLLLAPDMQPTYEQLLGISGEKPLDCVGEVKESRAAMRMASTRYPELARRYVFDLPDSYDYKALAGHEMPPEIYELFVQSLN